jgi:thiol-disulfide isomerase/thioredoxin
MSVSKPLRTALIGAAAALALAAGLVVHLSWRSGAPDSDAALALTLQQFPDLLGRPGSIKAWHGQVVIVNFWASWCPPCREEIPGLIGIHRRFSAKGVQVVGIAVDSAENARTAAAELNIPYPVLVAGIDIVDLTRKLGNRAGGLPFTVILDREGKVVTAHLGLISEAELARIVAPLSG